MTELLVQLVRITLWLTSLTLFDWHFTACGGGACISDTVQMRLKEGEANPRPLTGLTERSVLGNGGCPTSQRAPISALQSPTGRLS